jgi:hypothetical protein
MNTPLPFSHHHFLPMQRRMKKKVFRRGSLAALVIAVGTAIVASPPPLSADADATTVAADGADYFASAFGDPMDFGNQEDLVINTDEAMFVGGSNKSIGDGQLHFDTSGAFQFDPVWPGFPTGIPHGREGGRVPINADHYKRLVIRMNAPEGAPVGVRWFNCRAANSSCAGGQAFTARAGWNTYELNLGPDGTVPALTMPWSGQMLGLRFVGTVAGHFDIDWVRLAPADGSAVAEIAGGPTINFRPTDKLDYAAAYGNPWDMDSTADIVEQVNLQPGGKFQNNAFSGCTLGTNTTKFPGLVFNLPGGAINADRFTTLTFEYSYPGPFSARPVPGGGQFARVFWYSPDGKRHPTMAIHLYPNENVVQVKLNSPYAEFQGIEPGKGVATGAPWKGNVTHFRINPNDDRAPRCFTIGRVWLTSDEAAGTPVPPPSQLALTDSARKPGRSGSAKTSAKPQKKK